MIPLALILTVNRTFQLSRKLTVHSGPAAHYKQRKNRLYKYKRKSGKYLFAHKIMVNINLAQPTETALVLQKIEYWHQGSTIPFKIMCRDGKGFWHKVHWDGKNASLSPLGETDEQKVSKKLLG